MHVLILEKQPLPGAWILLVLAVHAAVHLRLAMKNSELVMSSWKSLMEEIGKNLDDFSGRELWMCKKCFSSYQRFGALKKSLASALLHVEPENFSSASKRPRVHPPALFQPSSSSASPDVAESSY